MHRRPAEQLDQAVDAVVIAAADIHGFARERRLGGTQEGPGHVGHVGEVTRLRTVAHDGERLAIEFLCQKHAEHRAIRAGSARTRAIDIEQPQ